MDILDLKQRLGVTSFEERWPGLALASPLSSSPAEPPPWLRLFQGRQDNSDVISAINAGIGAIVEAINASGNRPITIDGKTLMQSVERAQRQRGANIMGGGVLG